MDPNFSLLLLHLNIFVFLFLELDEAFVLLESILQSQAIVDSRIFNQPELLDLVVLSHCHLEMLDHYDGKQLLVVINLILG